MKKVIKRGLDLILCAALISSISFCFAWSDVSQYADTDVMGMSLSDLASLRTVDSRIKDQLSETQQDYDFLLQYSSSSAMLNEWTVYDLQTAASVIKTNNLTFEQANTLISSWKTATPSAENEIDLEYASILCKDPLSWKRFAFQHKNHKGRQRIGLRKDGQGNLLHPRSHPRCNQAAPCVCASVQPPHQTGQRCGSIGCSFFTSFKRKGPAPHGVEPFSKLFNYFKILRGSGLFIQHELSINRLLFQAFHLLAL